MKIEATHTPAKIMPLARFFIERANCKLGLKVNGLTVGVLHSLKQRGWPGNLRELEHAIESAMNFVMDDEILSERHFRRANRHGGLRFTDSLKQAARPPQAADESLYLAKRPQKNAQESPEALRDPPFPPGWPHESSLKEAILQAERAKLAAALKLHGGIINRAAAHLGLSPQLKSYKMKKHRLRREDFQNAPKGHWPK